MLIIWFVIYIYKKYNNNILYIYKLLEAGGNLTSVFFSGMSIFLTRFKRGPIFKESKGDVSTYKINKLHLESIWMQYDKTLAPRPVTKFGGSNVSYPNVLDLSSLDKIFIKDTGFSRKL